MQKFFHDKIPEIKYLAILDQWRGLMTFKKLIPTENHPIITYLNFDYLFKSQICRKILIIE